MCPKLMKLSSKQRRNVFLIGFFALSFMHEKKSSNENFWIPFIVVAVGDIFAVIQIRYGLLNFIRHNKYSGTCVSADKNIH
jgi:hypothetical protein